MQQRARAALTGMAVGSGAVLSAGPPNVGDLAQNLAAPHRWIELAGPDAAVATLAGALLWLVALWVAVSLVLTAGSLLPGRVGTVARAIARRLTPAALRRMAIAAAGTSILLTPATALATPGAAGSSASGSIPAAMPAVGWPTDPGPDAPATSAPATPAAPRPPAIERGASSSPLSGQVTVQPGDSLWSIAARRLGARPPASRIQQEWPRWYTTNRQLIGTDPALIRPGTRLLAPQPASTDTGA
jgi:nucleoid-associated protein YgaU